jgi:type IV pilus assembly protein PilF
MLRKKYSFTFVLLLLVGCAGQPGSGSVNFDQVKAAKTRVSLGLTYLKNGNYSQAKFNLDKAMEFAPRSADVNFALAYYYQKVGELEKAEEAYQYAMALDPRNADITNSYGAFLCQNGEYQKAKEYFLKAINTSNYVSTADTYENLALCSQSSGHPEDAVEYFRSAVNHQPGRANSLYLLAQSLIDTKQWQEARDILRRYERVAQVSPQSLLMAIDIEKGSGNYATAKEYRDMLIKVYPQHPEVIALLKDSSAFNTLDKKVNKVQKVLKHKKAAPIVPSPSLDNSQKQTNTSGNSAAKSIDSSTSEPNQVLAGPVETGVESSSQQAEQLQSKTTAAVFATEPAQGSEEKSASNEKPSYHIVAKGENLFRISLMYNIKMQRLVKWNGLSDASAIYQGMKLTLTAPDSEE